jgi:hypothetical protein
MKTRPKIIFALLCAVTVIGIFLTAFSDFGKDDDSEGKTQTHDSCLASRSIDGASMESVAASNRSGSHGHGDLSGKDRAGRKRALMEELRKNLKKPGRLLELIPEIKALGLQSDAQVKMVFMNSLEEFSPEQVAELLAEWPDETGGLAEGVKWELRFDAIFSLVRMDRDADFFVAILKELPADMQERHVLALQFAKRSEYFTPQNLMEILGKTPRKDWEYLARGLRERLDLGSLSLAEKESLCEQYFAVLEGRNVARFGKAVTNAYVEILADRDPLATAQWMLTQPPEMVSGGDFPLIQRLMPEHLDEAIDYSNKLRQRGEEERSAKVARMIAYRISGSDPARAVEWGLSMPKDDPARTNIVVESYAVLVRRDPAKAAEMLQNVADPRLREQMKNLLRRYSKRNSNSKEKNGKSAE